MTRATYDIEFASFVDGVARERRAPVAQTSVERWLELVQTES
jgi:hypothetical protein